MYLNVDFSTDENRTEAGNNGDSNGWLPVGETWRFAVGNRYDWSKNVTPGAAYQISWSGDLDMDVQRGPLAGRISGTYGNTAIHFVCLSAEWRF